MRSTGGLPVQVPLMPRPSQPGAERLASCGNAVTLIARTGAANLAPTLEKRSGKAWNGWRRCCWDPSYKAAGCLNILIHFDW